MREPGPAGAGAGEVVLVATPIGNLGDLAPRALAALGEADVIVCEDTRRTRALLSALGVPAGRGRLVSMHEHNEAARVEEVLDWVAGGRRVAVVSDAGTPGISDPGTRLVAAAAAAGVRVTVVPGPSAVLAALVVRPPSPGPSPWTSFYAPPRRPGPRSSWSVTKPSSATTTRSSEHVAGGA